LLPPDAPRRLAAPVPCQLAVSVVLEQLRTFISPIRLFGSFHILAIDGLSVDDMSLHDAQKDIVEFRSFIFISAED
jgi:hypothetical protein